MRFFYLIIGIILLTSCHSGNTEKKPDNYGKSENNLNTGSWVSYRDVTGLVKAKEFYRLIRECDTALILDARTPEEWETEARIQGSIGVCNYMLFKRAMRGIDKDRQIMVYCGHELRSPGIVKSLVRMGFNNIYELKGGLSAWKKKKFPLVNIDESVYKYED